MVYNGHIEKGVVVFDDLVALPEGLKVQVKPAPSEQQEAADNCGETLG